VEPRVNTLSTTLPELDEDLGEYVEDRFRHIDSIRSISQMWNALSLLLPITRKAVILHGFKMSTSQWTWSFMAAKDQIPRQEWPVQERL
jgi:hypothetical protein